MNENSICYLSGEFIRLADAKISVLDRGFIFGEGIYEVMAAINNDLLHYQLHFDRLRAGAYDMQLDISMSDCELHDCASAESVLFSLVSGGRVSLGHGSGRGRWAIFRALPVGQRRHWCMELDDNGALSK